MTLASRRTLSAPLWAYIVYEELTGYQTKEERSEGTNDWLSTMFLTEEDVMLSVEICGTQGASLYTLCNESDGTGTVHLRDARNGGCYEAELSSGQSEMWIADSKGAMVSCLNGMVREK